MRKIDKTKMESYITYIRASNSNYHINDKMEKLLSDLNELLNNREDNYKIMRETPIDKKLWQELDTKVKELKSFEEVEQLLNDNGLEYTSSIRGHSYQDGTMETSYYTVYIREGIYFYIKIQEYTEVIEEGDYMSDPIVEDKYAPTIFTCLGIDI